MSLSTSNLALGITGFDILLIAVVIIVFAWIMGIIIIPLRNRYNQKDIGDITSFVFSSLAGLNGLVYFILRRNLAPATWSTYLVALDFSLGFIIYFAFVILLYIVLTTAIFMLVFPILNFLGYSFPASKKVPIVDTFGLAFFLTIITTSIWYGATLFGNCSFYEMERRSQIALFGYSGSTLDLEQSKEMPDWMSEWFENRCRPKAINWNTVTTNNLVDEPIGISKAYTHLTNLFDRFGLGNVFSRIATTLSLLTGLILDVIAIRKYLSDKRTSKSANSPPKT